MAKSKQNNPSDYEVGYQKPPKATRFTKGQSGNPSGRPKGVRNWATVFHAALEQIVTINENGRQRNVTKLEAATMQLVNSAAAGDVNAIRLVLQVVPGMEAMVNKIGITSLSNAQDRKVLDEVLKRFQLPATEVIVASTPTSSKENSNE
ncbi:MAG: DUF5681 domain-containing protein [Methylotenera sp.]